MGDSISSFTGSSGVLTAISGSGCDSTLIGSGSGCATSTIITSCISSVIV